MFKDCELQLNPDINTIKFSENGVLFLYKEELINLSGPLFEKYFLQLYSLLNQPKKYFELIDIVKRNCLHFTENEFLSVINKLLSENILVKYPIIDSISKTEKNLLIIDFTSKNIANTLQKKINFSSPNINIVVIDVVNINDIEDILKKQNTNSFDIIIPIFWYVSFEILDKIFSNDGRTILPIICNYNYFSIGPQMISDETRNDSNIALFEEMKRYKYYNFSRYDTINNLFYAFCITEILEIFKYQDSLENNSRTIEEIITFNKISYDLKIKKYFDLESKFEVQ